MTYTKNIISDYVTLRNTGSVLIGKELVWEIPNVWYSNQRSNVCTVDLQTGLITGTGGAKSADVLQAETITPIAPTDNNTFGAEGDPVDVKSVNLVEDGLIVYYGNGAQNSTEVAPEGRSPLCIGHSPSGDESKGVLLQSCGKLLVNARPQQIRLSFENMDGRDVKDDLSSVCFTLRFDYYDSDDVAREMHKEMAHML